MKDGASYALVRLLDLSRARQRPEVHAVLTAADPPPGHLGKNLQDIPLLTRDRVLFIGDKIAVGVGRP